MLEAHCKTKYDCVRSEVVTNAEREKRDSRAETIHLKTVVLKGSDRSSVEFIVG